jgi:hypothetical protein
VFTLNNAISKTHQDYKLTGNEFDQHMRFALDDDGMTQLIASKVGTVLNAPGANFRLSPMNVHQHQPNSVHTRPHHRHNHGQEDGSVSANGTDNEARAEANGEVDEDYVFIISHGGDEDKKETSTVHETRPIYSLSELRLF